MTTERTVWCVYPACRKPYASDLPACPKCGTPTEQPQREFQPLERPDVELTEAQRWDALEGRR
ncbi:MAG: hypothetical protein Q4C89_12600 [Deinococcus sp.]|uniref:hypothetical protein n=1 Tax=Deinococcus sp. TaxID=47478 RepID=UPI0026DD3B7B|nr:hypothetical protein [Deinococcus sp.]MDO4246855.1 hypothetical protein [Deinococcus sp.]